MAVANGQKLGLFPSAHAIAMGDKEYHGAVNIAATMKARYNAWQHRVSALGCVRTYHAWKCLCMQGSTFGGSSCRGSYICCTAVTVRAVPETVSESLVHCMLMRAKVVRKELALWAACAYGTCTAGVVNCRTWRWPSSSSGHR